MMAGQILGFGSGAGSAHPVGLQRRPGCGRSQWPLYILSCTSSGDYCDSAGGMRNSIGPGLLQLEPRFFCRRAHQPAHLFPDERVAATERVVASDESHNHSLAALGKQVENTDALFFDVVNSYEVARCVRGREIAVPGQPNQHDYDDRYCFRASATGPARVRISEVMGIVHSTLSPRATCTRPVAATPTTCFRSMVLCRPWITEPGNRGSNLRNSALRRQNEQADPTARTAISPDFKIELNQRLYASAFSLTLQDQKVETAEVALQPAAQPRHRGSLTGYFDFDLKRGQGAQIFP